MERDRYSIRISVDIVYFNSHAHVERDSRRFVDEPDPGISTHTLTWSVTNISSTFMTFFAISTHTLTWSVTNSCLRAIATVAISTHTLTWSVTAVRLAEGNINAISTHTLTWSVT